MAGITHAFTSSKTDSADATLVRPSNWNASHVIGDDTMEIDAASSVGTFTLTSGSLIALTLGTTDHWGSSAHIFDWGSTNQPHLTLMNSSAGDGGPCLTMYQNSASPAFLDNVGQILYHGRSSTGVLREYGALSCMINSPTNAAESSMYQFWIMNGGTEFAGLSVGTNVSATNNYGTEFKFGSANTFNELCLSQTNAGAGGLGITTYANSASPAANDLIAYQEMYGEDSAGNTQLYNSIYSYIVDPTSTSEDSKMILGVISAGTAVNALTFGGTGLIFAGQYAHVFSFGANDFTPLVVTNTSPGSGGPIMEFKHESVSPAVSDIVGALYFGGKNSIAGAINYSQYETLITSPTSTTEGGLIRISTTASGANAARFNIAAGVYHASATGTDKGNNTTNFGAQYDDGTLLITCYVDEAARTGKIDIGYWDSLVPNLCRRKKIGKGGSIAYLDEDDPNDIIEERTHSAARKFAARLGTEYDPTKLSCQRKHVADKQHLTPYQNRANFSEATRPSLGQWTQRGVEMDELLFLYICQLEDRLKVLEAQ